MVEKSYDAIVIGGGPAGLIAATEMGREGFSVAVLEEHPQIGVPDHCAGLVSISGLKRIEVVPSAESIQNLVSGARIVAPNGSLFDVGGNEDKAYVLNRAIFDRSLAITAINEGVELLLNSRVNEVERNERGFVCAVSRGRTYSCRLLIDAEGISCRILRSLGVSPPSPDWIFPAAQFEISGVVFDPDLVELYFGQNLAPGFFAWSIPMNRYSSKIGLAAMEGNPLDLLKSFRERYFSGSQIYSIRLGRVFLGAPISKTYDDNLLIVGDAAGQTKPTTGGGVVVGGLCARIAGRIGANSLSEGDLAADNLSRYEKRWRDILGLELTKMGVVRRLFPRLSDDSLNRLLKFASGTEVREIIEARGDMDFQGEIINRLLHQPGIYRVLLELGGDLVRSLMK